jgi:hypothetical protein
VPINIKKNGRLYQFVLRDKVVAEDPYLVMVKAIAFAIRQREPYAAVSPSRSVLDFLVRQNVVGAVSEPPETVVYGPAPNAPPSIVFSLPTPGTLIPKDVPYTITGTTDDPDGTVVSVQLYKGDPASGGVSLGPVTGLAFWSNVHTFTGGDVGPLDIYAVAVDNQGGVAKTFVSVTIVP